jgi:hypothetical protein
MFSVFFRGLTPKLTFRFLIVTAPGQTEPARSQVRSQVSSVPNCKVQLLGPARNTVRSEAISRGCGGVEERGDVAKIESSAGVCDGR